MRVNASPSITAGTPQCLATALGCLPAAPTANTQPIWANRINEQMAEGTAAYGYHMDLANFAAGTVANKATAGHVTAQIQPATTTAPGLPFTDGAPAPGLGGALDITKIWIDVSATATVILSVDLRN